MAKKLGKLTELATMQQEKFRSAVAPVIKAQAALEKALNKNVKNMPNNFKISNRYLASFQITAKQAEKFQAITKQAARFQRVFSTELTANLDKIHKRINVLPPRTKRALLRLSQHGWYLDLDLPFSFLWDLENELESGKRQDVDNFLVQHYELTAEQIESRIAQSFPHRKRILAAAFDAHRRGDYELSVPIFIIQTDGICKETVNEHLFLKQNKKPRTSIYVDSIATDTFRAALLAPLASNLPITASSKDRDETFKELNRHTVLHGESIDYGSQINSCKAISLLHYVSAVLHLNELETHQHQGEESQT